jgi:hypothetical protein
MFDTYLDTHFKNGAWLQDEARARFVSIVFYLFIYLFFSKHALSDLLKYNLVINPTNILIFSFFFNYTGRDGPAEAA